MERNSGELIPTQLSSTLRRADALGIRAECGAITPEDSMKWDYIEPSRGQFNYGNADRLVDWAISNRKLICGHLLAWRFQPPSWVSSINDSATLTSVIEDHISNVVGRYSGKLYSWIVVDEAVNVDGTLRPSVFSRVLGENFIPIAFRAARAADPTAKLYINDFGLDSNNAKLQDLVDLVDRVNSGGTLIDGIGVEVDRLVDGASGIQAALTTLAASSATEIAITNMVMQNTSTTDHLATVNACLDTPKCVSVSTPCVNDNNPWLPVINGSCLLDINNRLKPVFNDILAIL